MAKHLRLIVEKKFWIQDAIKKPGALTSAAKRSKVSKSEYIQKHKHEGGKAGQRSRLAQTLKSFHKEEVELDEAKRPIYKRRGSLRAQVKSKATVAREQAGRRKAARSAAKEAKKTGEKIKIQPFGNWAHKRAAAKRKMQE